jgi:hypothetical protein
MPLVFLFIAASPEKGKGKTGEGKTTYAFSANANVFSTFPLNFR